MGSSPPEPHLSGLPPPPAAEESGPTERPNLADGSVPLTWLERANIAFLRRTFAHPRVDRTLGTLQRTLGAGWVTLCTDRLRTVVGTERLPDFSRLPSFVLASNHRSYFDMFVLSAVLFRHGLDRRMVFPVRSNFFYDHPLGFGVNGAMSFWSMYPPIFRDRKRIALNHTAIAEVVWSMKNQRVGVGMHPEGTRKKDDDPYTLLPAQSGVGRILHETRAPVIPAFIHGLDNDLVNQVRGNFRGDGRKIVIVFGAPMNLDALLDEPGNPKTYRAIAEAIRARLTELGHEEREVRRRLDHG